MARDETTWLGGQRLLLRSAGAGETKRARLAVALREAIRRGQLAPDTRLPSSRALGRDLGVSRGVVVDAYEQLAAEGYLRARRGSGTRVAELAATGRDQDGAATGAGPAAKYDFRPGPDLSLVPRRLLMTGFRRVLQDVPDASLGYGSAEGTPELRRALAAYLSRVRGVVAAAGNVVGTNGFAQALSLTLRALAAGGHTKVAVENPGAPEPRAFISYAGLEPVAVEVDRFGIRVDKLEESGARAVLVTPAHQFPMGAVLAPARRRQLLAWAERCDGLVIEDDYDAEYRYDRRPVGALQGLAPEHVLYLGSASKTVAPALRVGWMVPPARLRDQLIEAKLYDDLHSPALDQLVLADLVDRGGLERHLRRMRGCYRARRDLLLAALARIRPAVRVGGVAAGLHVVAYLPDTVNEGVVVQRAAERSLLVHGLDRYRATTQAASPALVIGFASPPEHAFRRGLETLVSVLG